MYFKELILLLVFLNIVRFVLVLLDSIVCLVAYSLSSPIKFVFAACIIRLGST